LVLPPSTKGPPQVTIVCRSDGKKVSREARGHEFEPSRCTHSYFA